MALNLDSICFKTAFSIMLPANALLSSSNMEVFNVTEDTLAVTLLSFLNCALAFESDNTVYRLAVRYDSVTSNIVKIEVEQVKVSKVQQELK